MYPPGYEERSALISGWLRPYPDLAGEWARINGATIITGIVIEERKEIES